MTRFGAGANLLTEPSGLLYPPANPGVGTKPESSRAEAQRARRAGLDTLHPMDLRSRRNAFEQLVVVSIPTTALPAGPGDEHELVAMLGEVPHRAQRAMDPGASNRRKEASDHQGLGHAAMRGPTGCLTPGRWVRDRQSGNTYADHMDLARHAAVLWRFRWITAAGVILGITLAVLASYKVTSGGLEPRGSSTYASESQLLITQAGFPEGRVVLPTPPPVDGLTQESAGDANRLQFADPIRFMALADLYTKLIVSDEVRGRIPERPETSEIVASPLPGVSGNPVLPIIQLTVTAHSAQGAQALNRHTVEALRSLLKERQENNDISPKQSVQIATVNAPSPGELTASPSRAGSILALLLCLIGTVALTHLLEALRTRREADGLENVDLDWVLDEDEDDARDDADHMAGSGAIVLPAFRGRPER